MGSRPVAICTSIWVVILGSINLALAIMGYMAYRCEIDMNGNFVGMALNLVYFYNSKCSTTFDVPPITVEVENVQVEVTFSASINPDSTERTNDWSIAYMALSSVWIFTSLVLLVSSCCRASGAALFLTLVPWVLTTLANLTADVVGTVYYMMDVFNTMSFRELVEFLNVTITFETNVQIPEGIEIPENVITEAIDTFKDQKIPFTWAPSAFMVFFFSRGLLIGWIITFILMIIVIVEATRKNKVAPKPMEHNVQPYITQQHPNYSNNQVMPKPVASAPNMTVDRLNNRPDNITPNKPYSSSPPESSWLARRTLNHTEVLDKPSELMTGFEQRMNNPSPRMNNEELRSQLPWSYTQDRGDQPRRTQLRPTSMDEAPPVPVPDYTLHFPKRKREEADRGNVRSITPPVASAPPAYKMNDSRSGYF